MRLTRGRADSMGAGFTPGFASRLRLVDGRRVFVKAADEATRGLFADSCREEIQKLGVLPDQAPAARLLWSHDADGWVALGLEDIEGRHPEHLPECERLADLGDEALAGGSVVHADARDDNLLIDRDDKVWLCDWNWPLRGNPAFDPLGILVSSHGDGHDADAWLARCRTTRGLDPDAVDGILSLLAGYFWTACHRPSPETSPWLRTHQRWYAEATTDWLARRRGWR